MSGATDKEYRPVSKWFRFDWQYVLRAGRLPVVKPIAAILVAFPAFGDLTAAVTTDTPGFVFIWFGSIASLLAFVFAWVRCPPLIREYESYKDYEDVGHTHRWIGWLFYLHRERYINNADVYRETIKERLALPESSASDPSALYDVFQTMKRTAPPSIPTVLPPTKINRDLYVGLWMEGQPYVLAMQEDDPQLDSKIKALFWIMATDLLPSRPRSRFAVWALYGMTLILLSFALLLNLATPAYDFYDQVDKFLFGWPT